ncbi:MAG TPA: MotA/TolQ/ExbB proton channel family protein [candidate division WOR-3 bacterium]|uniref:MotA/TolQ/ExbB proton channel family protein n=1 Tax=candidate division WOR-3 bacterium TaxID=2052148 RepID=A0A7V0T791_UNCW3|nr:MotA/TolQ/ExbB proton channel family protein [candidate division WOR-3 bacterium]
MIEWFSKGGMTMWFLLACAVLGLAIIIERLYTIFIKMRVNVKRFTPQLLQTIDSEGIQAGMELCDRTPSPVAKVLKAGLEKTDRGTEVMEDAIVRAGAGELSFLDRGMALLSGLVTVAPFFGFLGTVTGMIGAFAAVAAVGEVEPTVVASGISEALITTQAGLIIAAPLAIVHILLSGRVNGYLRDMERASTELLEYVAEKQHCETK